jgi:hypothetical protein
VSAAATLNDAKIIAAANVTYTCMAIHSIYDFR